MVGQKLSSGQRDGGSAVTAVPFGSESFELPMRIEPKKVRYAFAKRVADIFVSFSLLLLLLPLFIVLSIAVKLSGPGPVFYKSTRIGLCGRPFTFIKFRSMRTDADKQLQELAQQNEKDGPIFKMKSDPRITKIGAFLRKYSLDELPQLWSVFTGEMSIVGPRPPIPREVAQYEDYAIQRLTVKPGITCYWQIMGRSRLSFEEWMDLDHKYLRDMSFWTDCMILIKTPIAVVKGDGAY